MSINVLDFAGRDYKTATTMLEYYIYAVRSESSKRWVRIRIRKFVKIRFKSNYTVVNTI